MKLLTPILKSLSIQNYFVKKLKPKLYSDLQKNNYQVVMITLNNSWLSTKYKLELCLWCLGYMDKHKVNRDVMNQLLKGLNVRKKKAKYFLPLIQFITKSHFGFDDLSHEIIEKLLLSEKNPLALLKNNKISIAQQWFFLPKFMHFEVMDLSQDYKPIENKVAMIVHYSLPFHSNGYAIRSQTILKGLQNSAYDIVAITRPTYPKDGPEENYFSQSNGVKTSEVDGVIYEHLDGMKFTQVGIQAYLLDAIFELIEKFREQRPAVVHAASSWFTAIPAYYAAKMLGLPFIYEVRGIWELSTCARYPGFDTTYRFNTIRTLENFLIQHADQVITLTTALKEHLINRGAESTKNSVIPNTVDIEKYKKRLRDIKLANVIFPHQRMTVGYIGSMVAYEGLDLLLQAVAALKDKGILINLLMVGDGNTKVSLEALAQELDIHEMVYFTGRIPHEEISNYYSIIDICVYPRLSQPVTELVSPLKPFEAMANEKVVICSDVKAMKEFITHEKNGLLFEKDNLDSLVRCLESVINNKLLRDGLAQRGFDWVKLHRNQDDLKVLYEKIYASVLKQTSPEKTQNLQEHNNYTLFSKTNAGDIEITKSGQTFLIPLLPNKVYSMRANLKNPELFKPQEMLGCFPIYLNCIEGLQKSKYIGLYKYISVDAKGIMRLDFETNDKATGMLALEFKTWLTEKIFHLVQPLHLSVQAKKEKPPYSLTKLSSDSKNFILCADVDTNLIDGSSVWFASLAQTLSTIKNARVYLVLKTPILKKEVLHHVLMRENMYVIEPKKKLSHEELIDRLNCLAEQRDAITAIILRRYTFIKKAINKKGIVEKLWVYLTDIPQSKIECTPDDMFHINYIAAKAQRLLLQTDLFKQYMQTLIPQYLHYKISILPPMLPDSLFAIEANNIDQNKNGFKLVYAGKLAPKWGTRELFQAFRFLRANDSKVELHIIGDKIHNPLDDPDFKAQIERLLQEPAVIWHKRKTRLETLALLKQMDIAWGWRTKDLEGNTLELSTKLLEYLSLGLPTLLNHGKMNQSIVGDDYPYFADSQHAINTKLLTCVKTTITPIKDFREIIKADHSFSHVGEKNILPLIETKSAQDHAKRKILVAGHNLKFCDDLIDYFKGQGYEVKIDKWIHHDKHDVTQSRKLLQWADIIVCEWCLGNIVWYSKNKASHQKLIARFHLQELQTGHLTQINPKNIDAIIFVSQKVMREAENYYAKSLATINCIYIPNYVVMKRFAMDKLPNAHYNLGFVGILPQRKRLDLALDTLKGIVEKDPNYKLFIRSQLPKDLSWMKNRPKELEYYEQQFKRIEQDPILNVSVNFDTFGHDMPLWYRKIGYVLSTSDFESFHYSVAEGAASGAMPIILPWEGAYEFYPKEWIFERIKSAQDYILQPFDTNKSKQNQSYIQEKFNIDNIGKKWLNIIRCLYTHCTSICDF